MYFEIHGHETMLQYPMSLRQREAGGNKPVL